MSNLDFDDVLSDFDETDTYYSDSDYDPDEDSIECIECDELGNISDIYDIPYSDISGVADAAVGAGFHLKVNKPATAAQYGIKIPKKPKVKASVKVTGKGKLFPKKVVAAAPFVPSGILGPIVGAVSVPNASVSSILKAVAHVQTPVIKPGTKPAEVLKKLAVHPKIQGKVNTDQLKKLAVAMSVKPAVKVSASIPGPLGIRIPIPTFQPANVVKAALPTIAPVIAPTAVLPLPIPATSPAISKVEVSMPTPKVEHARKQKKLAKKRPKHSVTFIPPKKHEMICLGQMVPKRLYDLIIEYHKHKKQRRKERACKCAEAVKTTEKKLRATGGMAPRSIMMKGRGSAAKRGTKSGIKTIRVQPEQYIRIACGLPA